MTSARTVIVVAVPLLSLASCSDESSGGSEVVVEPQPKILHVTYAEYVDSPQDFIDPTGRRWHLVGPAKVATEEQSTKAQSQDQELETPEEVDRQAQKRAAFMALPRIERRAALAEKMIAVGLIGKPGRYFEYRSYPDNEMIDRLVDTLGEPAPPISPAGIQSSADEGGLKTKIFLDGIDDRTRVDPQTWWALRASGKTYSPGYECTLGIIGRHTAITAGHCVYKKGQGWTPPQVALGADLNASGQRIWPQGYYYPAFWTTNAWVSDPTDRDWDFALLDFGSSSVGYTVGGWFGVRSPPDNDVGYRNVSGYPGEKPNPTQWFQVYWGGLAVISGGDQMYFYNDVTPGQSGSCIFDGDYYCLGIFVSQSTSYNKARRWNTTTYNFFSSYGGGWPSN